MPSQLPPGFPGAPAGTYRISQGSITYSFSGSVNDCSVEGSGPIDLPSQPDIKDTAVLILFDGQQRTYQYQVPTPLFETVSGTASSCADPEDNGDFDWSPAAGVPLLANAPLPGGPVGEDWSITGSGSGDTGPGSPDQTWQWTLTPIP